MRILDKVRIKWKIRKICKVLRQLPEKEQKDGIKKILYCLKVTNEWKKKERFLDMLIEGLDVLCR